MGKKTGEEDPLIYECHNCGHQQGSKFSECPKCGSHNEFEE